MSSHKTHETSRWRRKSTWLPALLLIYLGVMSYIGLPELREGHYLYYFGIIGITLVVIALLHLFLKKRESAQK